MVIFNNFTEDGIPGIGQYEIQNKNKGEYVNS